MKTFLNFLSEATAATGANTHMEHPEDNAAKSKAGFEHAMSTMKAMHAHLTGHSGGGETHTSVKLDGSPAVIFGYHPVTGKFFAASKSAFNKEPKLNYSHEDIERNHGHSPGLAKKLHHAFEHLPKITPKKGMFQSDYMHDTHERHTDSHGISFKPNTVRYHIAKGSYEYNKAARSKIGVAIHTRYEGNPDHPATMQASPLTSHAGFKQHPDVHIVPHETKI